MDDAWEGGSATPPSAVCWIAALTFVTFERRLQLGPIRPFVEGEVPQRGGGEVALPPLCPKGVSFRLINRSNQWVCEATREEH